MIFLLAGAWGPPAASVHDEDQQQAVLVADARATRLVDPATGDTLWEGGHRIGAALGPAGTSYLGVGRDGYSEVFAVSPADPTPVLVASNVPGGSVVSSVSPDGDRLWLLTYADGMPNGLASLSLPTSRGETAAARRSYRDEGGGILLNDGASWFGLKHPGRQLMAVRFQNGVPLEPTPFPVALGHTTYSLLMSPDGRSIYIVDYGRQTITVVNTADRQVARTFNLDRRMTKGPLCAAVLSPTGDRLYIAGRDGNDGDGIDVIDTDTFQRVAHFFPGRDFYCLAITPDGTRLYADTQRELLTIDAATGEELDSVPIDSDPAPPYLGLATASG